VGTDQDKKFVLVVDQGNHVVYRSIDVGGMQGNLRVVKGGLKATDRIVVNGIQRVRPGDSVRAHMVPMTTDDDPNSAPLAQKQTQPQSQPQSQAQSQTRTKADKNS
jgi:multidrug efflux system membrane fusion protein